MSKIPILTFQIDEDDDSDVVVVKEEIDIDDGDDVIFLSETKPDPGPPKSSETNSNLPSDNQPDILGVSQAPHIIRSSSISTFLDHLHISVADTGTTNSLPLDLSAKTSSSGNCVNSSTLADASGISQGDPLVSFGFPKSSSCSNSIPNYADTMTVQPITPPAVTSSTPDPAQVSSNQSCFTFGQGPSCNQSSNLNFLPPSGQMDMGNASMDFRTMVTTVLPGSSLSGYFGGSSNVPSSISYGDPNVQSSNAFSSMPSSIPVPTFSVSDTHGYQSSSLLNNSLNTNSLVPSTPTFLNSPDASDKSTDPFLTSHLLLSTLDPLWSTPFDPLLNSGSSFKMDNILNRDVKPVSTSVVTANNGTSGAVLTIPAGLPGGAAGSCASSLPRSLSNPSAFRTYKKEPGTYDSSCAGSSSDCSRRQNPLKRSLSDQQGINPIVGQSIQIGSSADSQTLNSLSVLSSTSTCSTVPSSSSTVTSAGVGSLPVLSSSSSSTGGSGSALTHLLPPKKQKRCFSHGSENDDKSDLKSTFESPLCANCSVNLAGEKFSRCPNGHATCVACLEERVKSVLTGKTKESIRCMNMGCDSFYPISELKYSLPSMVVEILEDKLDLDISDMILKNACGLSEPEKVESAVAAAAAESLEEKPFLLREEESKDADLPPHWNPMEHNSGPFMVSLEPESEEYLSVVMSFYQSLTFPQYDVIKVTRVQNPILWKYYKVKKLEMLQDNEGFGVKEAQLFHGTSTSVVDAICKKGFDWRVCGKHGTMYGKGSYFAAKASYSHQYTDKPDRGLRSMSLPTAPPLLLTGQSLLITGPNLQQVSQITPVITQGPSVPTNNPSTSGVTYMYQDPQGLSIQPPQAPAPPPPYGSNPLLTTLQPKPSISQRYRVKARPRYLLQSLPQPGTSGIQGQKVTCRMFLARVLVGKYVGGTQKLRKPPPLDPVNDPFGKCYDSCVDNIHFPKIYVIFDSAQAYPEYLIEYTHTDG